MRTVHSTTKQFIHIQSLIWEQRIDANDIWYKYYEEWERERKEYVNETLYTYTYT